MGAFPQSPLSIAVRRVLVPGEVSAPVQKLTEPLSFWGGFDPLTGTIIDRFHPQRGAKLTQKILVLESGKGSSSGSSVLAEAIRLRTAPVGVVLAEVDMLLTVGVIAAQMTYNLDLPVIVAERAAWHQIPDRGTLSISHQQISWET